MRNGRKKMNIVIVAIKSWNISNFFKLEETYKNNENISFTLITRKENFTYEKIKHINPDWIFVPHWSWIIPSKIYTNYETVIFHMTDLPFGRGGSPLQNLLSRKIYETKVSALKCVKELDAGPIYCKKPLTLFFGSADTILSNVSDIVFKDMIPYILEENPRPLQQSGKITTFKRRTPAESCIEDVDTLTKVYDYIRMLDGEGYPNAFIKTKHFTYKFSNARITKNKISANVEVSKNE